eukprot:scaffold5014_cov387-Prasinococcus_capsulatus_cf.AAC.8
MQKGLEALFAESPGEKDSDPPLSDKELRELADSTLKASTLSVGAPLCRSLVDERDSYGRHIALIIAQDQLSRGRCLLPFVPEAQQAAHRAVVLVANDRFLITATIQPCQPHGPVVPRCKDGEYTSTS